MDLRGKMVLYILYSYNNIRFDRTITSEDQLKSFIKELVDLKSSGTNVKVLEIFNNLGY